ncbi:hypothetical protein MRX96_000444 [Rhipicephalus microplus]
MELTTLAATSRPPFRPPGCSNLGELSPLSDCQSFLAQRQWFYRSPRKSHITINASTTDAVDGRRRGCLETQDDLETWSTQRVGPIWVSSTEIEPVTGDDISDGDVAMIRRRRHVAVTNTRCLLDVERVKLEGEAFTRNIFGMKTTTRKMSELQEDVSGNATKTKRKQRRCEIGPANAAGIHDETQSSRTRILNSRNLRLVNLCTLAR